jgi:serine/threonine-protein kinase
MRHVREELADVQMLRPEVSASLAAVVDRATAKDLQRRYLDVSSLVADLEDVLAVETARAGQATGEATTVLRTLPGSTRRRLPLRLRVAPALAVLFLIAATAAVIAIIVLARGQTERGTRPAGIKTPAPGLHAINLSSSAAHAYDPLGDKVEHSDQARAAIDDDRNSVWTTESYNGGLSKKGVGLYVDAKPGVAARQIILRTATPGWTAAVYGATLGPPATLGPGWTKLADLKNVASRQDVRVDTHGKKYRYYLIWITALPPGQPRVSISDLALFA